MSNFHSIVQWYPDLEKYRCGYCKQSNTNCSYGMWAEMLTVEDYQNLIDRGWRRSGKYCYKPVMDKTCCPLYTIRCEALNFKLSKSQKKLLKRVNKFLSESVQEKCGSESTEFHREQGDTSLEFMMKDRPISNIDISKIDTVNLNLSSNSRTDSAETEATPMKTHPSSDEKSDKHSKMNISTSSLITKGYKTGTGADPNKPPCKKAKLIRLEKKQHKLAAKGITDFPVNPTFNQGKTLEEFINDVSKSPAHQLRICLVKTTGSSKEWQKTRSQEYPVYRKYQMAVHGDAPEKCSERQFSSFLFESPLQYCNPPDGPPCGYGSFHQQYWLDDKLIAVGVIDILPKCVSSVYFFYDPDYRHLTLGTYGSLREVEFTRQLYSSVPRLKYYYMGFYIHTCPKMRYKANVAPSFLLCPETYMWFPIEKCIPKLDAAPYCRLNDDIDALDENACSSSDIDEIIILIDYRTCIPYKYYKTKVRRNKEYYILFGNMVGKKCVSQLLLLPRDSDFT